MSIYSPYPTSYLNDPLLKVKYTERMKAHMAADELIQGVGYELNDPDDLDDLGKGGGRGCAVGYDLNEFNELNDLAKENGRGCAVGCTLNAYQHAAFEWELGIPIELAHLLDTLHENTSDKIWPTYALQFLEAIPVGVDLRPVILRIRLFTQVQNLNSLNNLLLIAPPLRDRTINAIQGCIDHLKSDTDDDTDDDTVRLTAERAAWDTANVLAHAHDIAAEEAKTDFEERVAMELGEARWAAESAAWGADDPSAKRSTARAVSWSVDPECRSDSLIESIDAVAAELLRLLRQLTPDPVS